MKIELIDTAAKVKAAVDYLSRQGRFAWDHETRSYNYAADPNGALDKMRMKSDLVSFSTTKRCFVAPLGLCLHKCIDEAEFFDLVRPMMEDPDIVKEGWNASFDLSAMANYSVWVQSFEDYMVAAWLLDENRPKTLKDRCTDVGMQLSKYDFKTYWKMRAIYRGEIEAPKRGAMSKISHSALKDLEDQYLEYSGEDAIATAKLGVIYREELAKDPKLEALFYRHRNPAVRTIFHMERRGIAIDTKFLADAGEQCKKLADEAEKKIYSLAGKHFNLGSTKELSDTLYQDLGLPVYKTTDKGANSTDKGTLGKLAQDGDPVARALLDWRQLNKLYTTYLAQDSKLVSGVKPWKHLHASFNVVGTDTGRLSSNSPNIQQIPRSTDKTFNIRKAFVADPGYTLVGGDLSQIELRIMADASQCSAMIEEYRKDEALWRAIMGGTSIEGLPKSDIHQSTADSCRSTRNQAKGINFGLLYGMGSKKLAEVLTIANWTHCLETGRPWDPISDIVDESLAREFIDLFFGKYPEIRMYQKAIADFAMQHGYVRTRYGQKRRLPDIYASDKFLVHGACRQAVNTTVQGHVGELMLHCMNIIERDEELNDYGYQLSLQVHDEIMGQVPTKWAEKTKLRLAKIIQCPGECTTARPYYGYRIPIVFEPCSGESWHTVH